MSGPRGRAGRRAPCWWGTVGQDTGKTGAGGGKQDKEIIRRGKTIVWGEHLEKVSLSDWLSLYIDSYNSHVEEN